jgi:hypothetical protein
LAPVEYITLNKLVSPIICVGQFQPPKSIRKRFDPISLLAASRRGPVSPRLARSAPRTLVALPRPSPRRGRPWRRGEPRPARARSPPAHPRLAGPVRLAFGVRGLAAPVAPCGALASPARPRPLPLPVPRPASAPPRPWRPAVVHGPARSPARRSVLAPPGVPCSRRDGPGAASSSAQRAFGARP